MNFAWPVAVLICLCWSEPGAAQQPAESRSLVPGPHEFIDELELPRFVERSSHRGWEVRSPHFAVTSDSSLEQARQMAAALEATWEQLAAVADLWTDLHRGEAFQREPLGVFVSSEPVPAERRAAPGPRATNDGGELYVYLHDLQPSSADEVGPAGQRMLTGVRQEMVRAFLRRTHLDVRLPEWLQQGVAELVTLEPGALGDPFAGATEANTGGSNPTAEKAPAAVANDLAAEDDGNGADAPDQMEAPGGAAAGRPRGRQFAAGTKVIERGKVQTAAPLPGAAVTAEDDGAGARPEPTEAEAGPGQPLGRWLLAQLVADDGLLASEMFERLAALSVAPGPLRRLAKGPNYPSIAATMWNEFREPPLPAHARRPEDLPGPQPPRDPWQAQPVLVAPATLDEAQQQVARQLVMLWKLARRFPYQAGSAAPRVLLWDAGRALEIGPRPPAAQRVELDWLAAHLAQRQLAPWAMVGADGRLLWSGDRVAWESLFDTPGADRPLVRIHQGRTLIERPLDDGQRLVSWLEVPAAASNAQREGLPPPRWQVHVDFAPPRGEMAPPLARAGGR